MVELQPGHPMDQRGVWLRSGSVIYASCPMCGLLITISLEQVSDGGVVTPEKGCCVSSMRLVGMNSQNTR